MSSSFYWFNNFSANETREKWKFYGRIKKFKWSSSSADIRSWLKKRSFFFLFIKFDGPACANSNQRKQWLYSNADKFYFIFLYSIKNRFQLILSLQGTPIDTHINFIKFFFFFRRKSIEKLYGKKLNFFFILSWVALIFPQMIHNAHFIKHNAISFSISDSIISI